MLKKLIFLHLVLLALTIIDVICISIADISIRGALADRIILLFVFVSAIVILCKYHKGLSVWFKMYYGSYIAYPLLAVIVFLIDKIAFAIMSLPFLLLINYPEIYYRDKEYELREQISLLGIPSVLKNEQY